RNKILEEVQKQIAIVGQKTTAEREKEKSEEEKLLQNLDHKSKESFSKAMSSCNISTAFFINGAKSAFEMVIKAFSNADLETLKFLLSEKIYQSFEQAISQRKASGKVLVSNIISIDNAEVISALIIENKASIVVKIISKQINYVSDQNGEVLEGSKNEINELTDIWTFTKDITAQDPNWIIVSTHS
ncbi:MAG: Tim44 domain-containing protein, partial [Pelagibacterales bacterium]|nr:Tim44 domain-containing protein [Pelagibacterales bacterium]